MLCNRKTVIRNLILVSVPITLWAFLMAVTPVSCDYSPWRAENNNFNNQLYLLVNNLSWIDSGANANLWDGNIIPKKVFQSPNAQLLSVETNGANISYTIHYNKLTGLFSRRPVLVHVKLIRTNELSKLLVDGVSEDISERLQRLIAARTNGVLRFQHPILEVSQ